MNTKQQAQRTIEMRDLLSLNATLQKSHDSLVAQHDALVKALQFYANPNIYEGAGPDSFSSAESDAGHVASTALEFVGAK